MQVAFDRWRGWRRFSLPTQEERDLKKKLAESKVYRSRNAYESASTGTSDNNSIDRHHAISNIQLPKNALAPLPVFLRRHILDYCCAVEDSFLDDLQHLEDVVKNDELGILNTYHNHSSPPPQERSGTNATDVHDEAGVSTVVVASTRVAAKDDTVASTITSGATHPLVAILDVVESELATMYEGRILHELSAFARCFGVPVSASMHNILEEQGSMAPRSPTVPSSTRRRSLVTYVPEATPPPAATAPPPPSSTASAQSPPLSHRRSLQQQQQTGVEMCSYHQRDTVVAYLQRIYAHTRSQRDRFERALSWVRFRDNMLHSTCASLRPILRDDLSTWEMILQQWRMPNRCSKPNDAMPNSNNTGDRSLINRQHQNESVGSNRQQLALDPDHVDFIFERALMELGRYQARISSVEYLGRPDLSLDDIRNLFWEVGLTPPVFASRDQDDVSDTNNHSAYTNGVVGQTFDGVTETYAQTITFRQALTLGLTEIPWVRGYSWEDRATAAIVEEVDEGDDKQSLGAYSGGVGGGGASARSPKGHHQQNHESFDGVASDSGRLSLRARSPVQPMGGTTTSNPLMSGRQSPNPKSRSVCSVARSERVLQMLGNHGVDDTVRQQLEELERERASLEAADQALRRKAFAVAAHAMSQRLWLSTDLFRPHGEHQFAGCEYCADTHLAMVGLKRDNSGAVGDIVVCSACYQDLYSDELSIAHRMYQWLTVQELIGAGVTAVEGEAGSTGDLDDDVMAADRQHNATPPYLASR